MPKEQRRKALITATIPLIQQNGMSVTTRQVAEAAGVAEGTIFRVFDSLQDLVQTSVMSALSRENLEALLADCDLGDTLEDKTRATLVLFGERIDTIHSLMVAVHHTADTPPAECLRDELTARRNELEAWLTERFTPHADELRIRPREFVSVLRALSTGNSFHSEHAIDISQTISIALHGAARKDRP